MATLLKIEGIHKTFEAGTVNENHVLKRLGSHSRRRGFHFGHRWKWSWEIDLDEYSGRWSAGGQGISYRGKSIKIPAFGSVRKILRVFSKILRWGQLPV